MRPSEIVVEDRRAVATFLAARLHIAEHAPSRNTLDDLVIAIGVGHRRAQRALSLVFEGTENAPLKRSLLRRYALLDRVCTSVREGVRSLPVSTFLDMSRSVIESIDSGFEMAFAHLDEVRNSRPPVDDTAITRPIAHRDPEGTTTRAWFSRVVVEDDAPTHRVRGDDRKTTRRGH